MAKKVKIKKTLVEQILSKAGIPHQGIQINALEGELPQGYERDQIFKTLALLGDKTGPIIGIVPITQHLSEKKLAKISSKEEGDDDIPNKRKACVLDTFSVSCIWNQNQKGT